MLKFKRCPRPLPHGGGITINPCAACGQATGDVPHWITSPEEQQYCDRCAMEYILSGKATT